MVTNQLCQENAALVKQVLADKSLLILELMTKLPQPESCQNIPQKPIPGPGILAIETEPLSPALSQCLQTLNARYDYYYFTTLKVLFKIPILPSASITLDSTAQCLFDASDDGTPSGGCGIPRRLSCRITGPR
jgi:hypothetical protein